MPEFFVPMIDPDMQDDAYREMAALFGGNPAEPGARIRSITWKHNSTVWTATVGEELRGTETIVKGRGRDKRYLEVPRSTNDTVLAIFAGAPYVIVHDNKSRIWNQPIYAGNPSRVATFGG